MAVGSSPAHIKEMPLANEAMMVREFLIPSYYPTLLNTSKYSNASRYFREKMVV
jgi:hypothetical protein